MVVSCRRWIVNLTSSHLKLLSLHLMKITIDKAAGFCPGVKRAIIKAEKELRKGEDLASYGSILHNELEMQRLKDCGLTLAGKDDFPKLSGKKLLFRAHGEPPSTYALAGENNVEVLDATCGVVRRLQQKVKEAAAEMEEAGGQVVIYGKPMHPEVVGLMGQIKGRGIVVSAVDDLDKIDPAKPLRLFSQTTMDQNSFNELSALLEDKLRAAGNNDFISHNTICRHVLNRIPSLSAFAARHDVIIFVSGRESSNGNKLFRISKAINPRTYFISDAAELEAGWFSGAATVGVSGAASTPEWLMKEVAMKIKEIN